MDYNSESVLTFDKNAVRYAEKYFSLRNYDAYYDRITSDGRNGSLKFLDLACGPGNVAAYIREHCPQAKILCVDRSLQMLAQVRQRVPNVEVLAADCRDLSGIDERFNAAAFFFGLSYFDSIDAAKVLSQLHEILLPGASMLLASVSGDPSLTGMQVNVEGDRVFSFYREQSDIERMLIAAGFEIVQSEKIPSPENASIQSNDVIILGKKQ
jgi:ubiquinone/menaquinone biosynthesis C-methylase UbiE